MNDTLSLNDPIAPTEDPHVIPAIVPVVETEPADAPAR
jgi:hypothetical protein